ncbi:MAG: DUF2283 domain-containing protein [Candidatus Baldrarchaeia archaeon]
MKIRYDPEADILYILIKEGSIRNTVEISDDLFIEYDENNNIVGIEIWQARKNVLKELMEYIKDAIKAATKL